MNAHALPFETPAPRETAGTAHALVDAVRRIAATPAPDSIRLARLRGALERFAARTRVPVQRTWRDTASRYTRVLLNDPGEAFQIVVVFWPPGARSAIHDHDETLGAVMPLFGQVHETKYRVEPGATPETVELIATEAQALEAHTFSPITAAPGEQLHDVVNHTSEWAATVHVYLRGIDRFHVYAARPEGGYHAVERALWLDYTGGWRTWDAAPAARRQVGTLEGRGGCLCGAVRVDFAAPPALELICHCTDCQRASGAAAVPFAFFPAEALCLTGEVRAFGQRNESGHLVERRFCTACGTVVLHGSDSAPHLLGVPVGVLDDQRGFDPTTEIFVNSAPHWARAARAARRERPTLRPVS